MSPAAGSQPYQRTLQGDRPSGRWPLCWLTLVLLFGFQGRQAIHRTAVGHPALLAVPILSSSVYLNAGVAYLLNRQCGSSRTASPGRPP